LILYGTARSRASRCLWLLEEVEADYEFIVIDFRKGDHLTDWFLAMNPNGKVPVLKDGNLNLFESAAICNYLGVKFPHKALIPSGSFEKAKYDQWMFFVMSELEQPLWSIGKHKFALPAEYRLSTMKKTALFEWQKALDVLKLGLGGGSFLLGGQFTIADIMTVQTLQWAKSFGIDIGDPKIEAYRERCISRPAFRAVVEKYYS